MVAASFRQVLAGVLLVCGCLITTKAGGQQLDASQQSSIDTAVVKFMKKQAVPGCSISLGTRGGLAYAQGYGKAGPNARSAPDTIYRIGSLTKQFTAALVLMAARAQDGKPLSIDAPLATFYPRQKQWAGVTIRHLLTHTSGIPSYTAFRQFTRNQFKPISPAGLLKLVKAYDQAHKPGSKGQYSNTNYLLLAHILQTHTGLKYADLMTQNIFAPQDMGDTAVITRKRPGKRTARGYDRGRVTSKRTHASWAMGVGDLESTALDMAQWNLGLLDDKLLSEAEKAQMFAAVKINIEPAVKGEMLAMGWMDISKGGEKRFYHQGYLHGFSAVNLLIEPLGEDGRFVTVLCNAHLVQKMPDLAIRIARLF